MQTPPRFDNTSKEELIAYFIHTFNLYDKLFNSIREESGFLQIPDPLRRPLIFYLGHTSALYVNKFKLAGLMDHDVNEQFQRIFATGVDPIYREELDNDVYQQKLPDLRSTWEFRRQVYESVLNVIKVLDFQLPIDKQSPWWCLMMGCEHERIHFETSTVLLRQLPVDYLVQPNDWIMAPYNIKEYPKNDIIEVKGQKIHLGKPQQFPTYGWDCEYGSVDLWVNDFNASKYLISNGEYLEFVQSGGYENQIYWSEEGWQWKQLNKQKKPLFWIGSIEDGFKYRSLYKIIDMPLDWPVDVNYHEARAFCKWKGPSFRMGREGEFNVIRGQEQNNDDIGAFSKLQDNMGNKNLKYCSSSPVDMHQASLNGFYDTYGNVWEWSEDYYYPLPEFKTDPLYTDYSGGCFDQYHQMILGSSWSSTGLSASSYVRLAFRRHFYQNCGFRLYQDKVQQLTEEQQKSQLYEDNVMLSKYLHFNYGDRDQHLFTTPSNQINLQNYIPFPIRVAQVAYELYNKHCQQQNNIKTALDLGCGMGKTAFELAKWYNKVDAIDYSRIFMQEANRIKQNGIVNFQYVINGSNQKEVTLQIDSDIDRSRVQFIHGDAQNLPQQIGPYDLIVACNLIDRLPNPIQCLMNLQPLLNFNGLLVIISPYTWMNHVTPKQNWIGGKDGISTYEALKNVMESLSFHQVDQDTLTLFIREHERKFEFILPHLTAWKKNPFCQEFATSIFKTN